MAKQFTLGKNERLKSRKLIDQVFREGKKFTLAPYRVHYLYLGQAESMQNNLRVGAGVSTKNFKRAVDRNRIRRLTKEAWRLQKKPLQEKIPGNKQLAVFLLYAAGKTENYQLISEKIKKIIDKLCRLVAESP